MHTYDNTLPLKSFDTPREPQTPSAAEEKAVVSRFERFIEWFWQRTEQVGKADTDSFRGLL